MDLISMHITTAGLDWIFSKFSAPYGCNLNKPMCSFTQDSTQGGIDELNWTREPGTLSSDEDTLLITLEMWQQQRSKVTFTSCWYLDIFCEKIFLQRKVFFSITRRRDVTVKLFWDVNHLLSCLRIYWAPNSLIERVKCPFLKIFILLPLHIKDLSSWKSFICLSCVHERPSWNKNCLL